MKFSQLRPFFWTSVIWLGLSSSLAVGLSQDAQASLLWVLVIGGLSLLDLFAIAQLVRQILAWAAAAEQKNPGRWVPVAFWGALKLGCLALLIMILYTGRSIPIASVLSGLATLIVVPLFGGMWWWTENHSGEGV